MMNIFRTQKSFSARLSLWVTLAVAIVLTVTAIVTNIMVRDGILREEKLRAGCTLDNVEQRIDGVLIAVETAVKNHVGEIGFFLHAPREEMYRITRMLLETNPNIVGSAIAFEPDYFPEQGRWFSPYSWRDGDTIRSKQLGTADYEYHDMEWYTMPKLQKRDCWSEPYRDVGGGEMTMTTYSHPLYDEKGQFYGVVTADVSLDWLSGMMDSLNYYDDAYSFIIGRSGPFITYPDEKVVLNETVFTRAKEHGDSLLEKIGYEMVDGRSDMRPIKTGSFGRSFIFYQPVKHNGWSMAIVCSSQEFFNEANRMGVIVVVIILVMLLLLTFILRHAVRHLTRPLEHFTRAVDEVAQGNLQAELPEVNTKDEMMRLHNSFSTMQQSLAQQMEELKAINEQKGRIEGELHVASAIQMGMLPKTFPTYPDRDDVQLFGELTPAKEVGGDLFDFFIRDEKLFFCIGDVSGKGVPASLVMAVTRSLFRSVSAHESMPDRIVTSMNESMADMNESNMFVTLFVGVLDLPTGRMRYCNAGHDAPLLVGSGVGMLPVEPNIPVAVMSGWKFQGQEAHIYTGTTIFLFTDGLTEAEDKDHAQFRMERIEEVATQALAAQEQAPKLIIKRMSDAVHQFVGDAQQSDDLTMLAIQYIKQQSDVKLQKAIVLPNDTQEVPRLAAFVDEVCEAVGFDMGTTMKMNLALEEAVVNVMNYAYPSGTRGDINIVAQSNDLRLKFTITDSGAPFDPTAKTEVDTTLSAEERPIGGLGIHLVRQIMDSINYERIDGRNVLTLRKKLNKQQNTNIKDGWLEESC